MPIKLEDRPLADPFLPRAARFALIVFFLTALGAFAWAMWLLWVNVQHPVSWSWALLWFSYLGWSLWRASRKATKRRREAEAGLKNTIGPENMN